MAQVAPSTTQIQAHVQRLRRNPKVNPDLAVGIRSAAKWSGDSAFVIDGRSYDIAWCTGPLEARARLAEYDGAGQGLVLVTPLDEHELGADVVARLARSRLETIRAWDMVLEQFQAQQLDTQVAAHRWIADALLAVLADGPFEAVPTGVLDAETVWRVLLSRKLGIRQHPVDLESVLSWTRDADGLRRYASLDDDFRKGVREQLTQRCGPAASAVLDCVDAGHGADAVALGLVCRVIFHESGGNDPAFPAGAVRLEKYTMDHAVSPAVGRRWASAAEAVARRVEEAEGTQAARGLLYRGDQLLAELKAHGLAHLSGVLPEAFEHRLRRYGTALSGWLASRTAQGLESLAAFAQAASEHDQAPLQCDRVRRVEMSLRLARYLASAPAVSGTPVPLDQIAGDYARDGGFVDWARSVMGGEGQATVADAYSKLAGAILEQREQQNERFARALSQWTVSATSEPKGELLPIECVLDQVIAPLAEQGPVLFLVIDGMSYGVFRELQEDLVGRHAWVPLSEEGVPGGRIVVSTVPSVTEFARTSLFCGKLARGGQQESTNGFSAHPALVAASRGQGAPVLFHKAALESAHSDLSSDLRAAIASHRRVVGVVINAVDDHLLKGDQVQPRWTVEYIRMLRPLLHEAALAGRTLVLASDHGHIIARRAEATESDRGERWRSASPDAPPNPFEMEVSGPRVLGGNGRLVAQWSERVRAGVKKNGYHGGISPQEMLAPIAVLAAPQAKPPAGYAETALYTPQWWDVRPQVAKAAAPEEARAATKVEPVRKQGTLFDLPETPAAATRKTATAPTPPRDGASAGWLEALLASPVYESQKRLAGRTLVPEATARAFLEALAARGGAMLRPALARHLELPPLRLPGVVAAMRRLLNVDGVDVLSVDDASDTVTLDVARLRLQFDLN